MKLYPIICNVCHHTFEVRHPDRKRGNQCRNCWTRVNHLGAPICFYCKGTGKIADKFCMCQYGRLLARMQGHNAERKYMREHEGKTRDQVYAEQRLRYFAEKDKRAAEKAREIERFTENIMRNLGKPEQERTNLLTKIQKFIQEVLLPMLNKENKHNVRR